MPYYIKLDPIGRFVNLGFELSWGQVMDHDGCGRQNVREGEILLLVGFEEYGNGVVKELKFSFISLARHPWGVNSGGECSEFIQPQITPNTLIKQLESTVILPCLVFFPYVLFWFWIE